MSSTDARVRGVTREQVLDLSVDKKLEYFEEVVVRHPRMDEMLGDLVTLSARGTGSDLILLIGPSGAGKSATAKAAQRRFAEMYKADQQSDPSFVPFVSVEAKATGEKQFSWRVLYTRIGEGLNEPLLDRKLPKNQVVSSKNDLSTVAGLREAIEEALTHRRTRLVIIDEAAHILAGCGDKTLIAHMNALKSIANFSGATLALVGSYDLYKLAMLSGQLARRTAVIHFSRYLTGRDEAQFRSSLRTLERRLPLTTIPDLTKYSSHLQTACAGCIGTLKDTLTRALSLALHGGGRWKDDYLRKALLSEAALATILDETLEGEKLLAPATYGMRSVDWLESA